jgi:hypothetical protein
LAYLNWNYARSGYEVGLQKTSGTTTTTIFVGTGFALTSSATAGND